MAHHAYIWSGEGEQGIALARAFSARELGLSVESHPDLLIFRHGLFSVEDARKLAALIEQGPIAGPHKALIISVTRLFHEAQNALLKIFEEPPHGITLFLIVPREGIVLPTLRSRLVLLPHDSSARGAFPSAASAFLSGDAKARESYIGKLLERSKSDKEDIKQAARSEAIQFVEGLLERVHASWENTGSNERLMLLRELETFLPILHERSAPYKLIFEHLALVIPQTST